MKIKLDAFNMWVYKNFKGLNCATLCQLLNLKTILSIQDSNNLVYCDLFAFFKGDRCDKNVNAYELCKNVVANCSWL